MKWTHRFRIDAPVEVIYEVGFAPDRWFSFYGAYRGLESVDPNWPQQGSTITIRYAVFGPWTIKLKQTVVEHERGRRIRMYEEALSGLWIDRPEFRFEPEDGATSVTLTVDPTSKVLLGRLLILLISLPFTVLTPRAMKRFRAMIESSSRLADSSSGSQLG